MASLTRCYVLVPAGVSVYLIPDLMHVGFDHSFALDFFSIPTVSEPGLLVA